MTKRKDLGDQREDLGDQREDLGDQRKDQTMVFQCEGEGKAPQLPAGARTEGPVGP